MAGRARVLGARARRADLDVRGPEHALDLVLGLVGELEAVAAEELDPVVLVGVVRRREHDAEVEPVAADQQRRAGRRQDAAEQRLAARRGDARGHGGLEHVAGLARVADDQRARRVRDLIRHAGRRRPREGHRELRGEELAGDAADAIGAEQGARHGSGASAPDH
jgi:hypothetical protein